jgi:hypothetical protein
MQNRNIVPRAAQKLPARPKTAAGQAVALLLAALALCLFPLAGSSQYSVFQKTADHPAPAHVYPTGQGYVLTFREGSIARTDANLDVLWRRSLGTPQAGLPQIVPVASRAIPGTDRLLVVGQRHSTQFPTSAAVMIETDASGAPLWARDFPVASMALATATTVELAMPTSDGGFVAAGQILNSAPGAAEWYLLKLSASGTVDWSAGFRSSGQEALRDIRQLPNGDYIVAFTVDNEAGLLRLNAAGQVLWGRRYATGQPNLQSAWMDYDPVSGRFVVLCTTVDGAKGLLFKTTAIGDIVWSRAYSVPVAIARLRFQGVQVVADSLIIGGTITPVSPPPLVQSNSFMLKTDSLGHEHWNSLFVSGGHHELVRLSPGSGGGSIFCSAMVGNPDQSLLIRMDASGYTGLCPGATLLLTQSSGAVANGNPAHPSPMQMAQVSFIVSAPYNISAQSLPIPPQTVICSAVVSTTQEVLPVIHPLQIFPNPATDQATLTLDAPVASSGLLQLFDLSGKMVYSTQLGPTELAQPIALDLTRLPPGGYIARVVTGSRLYVGKLAKN